MSKTKSKKISDKQKAIDELWRKFNRVMGDLEELGSEFDEYEDEHEDEINGSTKDAVYEAYSSLESVYSYGESILPKHSADGGKA